MCLTRILLHLLMVFVNKMDRSNLHFILFHWIKEHLKDELDLTMIGFLKNFTVTQEYLRLIEIIPRGLMDPIY